MRFEVLQESIKRALSVVLPAVATKITLPVLMNVQLSATEDGRLALSGTNLESGTATSIGARVENIGAVTLPAKLLADLVNGLPNAPIAFDLDERSQVVTLRSGKFKTEIHGLSCEEFPVFPAPLTEPAFTIAGAEWKSAIDSVAGVAGDIDGIPSSGMHIKAGDNRITLEAYTDGGVRCGIAHFEIETNQDVDLIISAKALAMAAKVFSGVDVSFSTSANGEIAVMSSESTTVFMRSIAGNFPNVSRAIPSDYKTRILIDSSELSSVLKLATPFASADANRLVFNLSEVADMDGKLIVSASAREIGAHSAVVDCLVSGDPVAPFKLHAGHLSYAIAACGTKMIALEVQRVVSPIAVRPVDGADLVHVLAPFIER